MSIITTCHADVDLLNPRAETIFPVDIIVSLGRTTRWRGLTHYFYSVAQHSILVGMLMLMNEGLWAPDAEDADPTIALPADPRSRRLLQIGLLHDASEAYMADISAPLKDLLPNYRRIENRLSRTIYSRFGLMLSTEDHERLHIADVQAAMIERDYLFPEERREVWECEAYHPGLDHDAFFVGAFPPQAAIQIYGQCFGQAFPMVSGYVH